MLGWHVDLAPFCLPLRCGPKGVCRYIHENTSCSLGTLLKPESRGPVSLQRILTASLTLLPLNLLESGAQRLDHRKLTIIMA